MQQTRLNTLLILLFEKLGEFFTNPWRRLSLIVISLLFGFFFASAISTILGQQARLDVTGAFLILVFCEVVSILVYGRAPDNQKRRSLFWSCLNYFKIGIIYGLFLEAFKLGS
jgi:ACR3 family arsenite efflux pump ArsB